MKTICIDAGHGGTDPGASGNGVVEKDAVLTVVKKLGNLLKNKGFNIVYTRLTDTFVKLNDRCKIANNVNADLFVSVHINSASSADANGTETLCYSTSSFATTIHKHLISKLKRRDRGVKTRQDLAVLNGTKMNAVLVELAFLSNKEEANLLKKDDFLNSSAQAICDGICEYLGVKNTVSEQTTSNTTTTNTIAATKKAIDVELDGKLLCTDGYFINGSNLFTADFIRYLGYDVAMNPDTKVVEIVSNIQKQLKVVVNGKEETVTSIFKNNLNHIMLKDLANLGLFELEYKDGVVYINSIK